MITGDRNFVSSERFSLQESVVEKLEVVYWGRGSAGWRMWPKIPAGMFDVVTSQDPFWRGLFAWRAARRMGAKLNIQVHTSVLNILGKFILRRADSIRVVSQIFKKQVEGMGVKAPVHVLPVYIDISKFRNIVRQPHSQKTILWVGRFESEKNPALALSILQAVLRSGMDARLVMLGVGSLAQKLKARAHAAGLPVEFPGWQDPATYLAQADVVLCTSKHESWGASMIEALAAGVPVVAPDVGIAREAGADVVARSDLAQKTIEVLNSGRRGELKLNLPGAQEWARQWKETL